MKLGASVFEADISVCFDIVRRSFSKHIIFLHLHVQKLKVVKQFQYSYISKNYFEKLDTSTQTKNKHIFFCLKDYFETVSRDHPDLFCVQISFQTFSLQKLKREDEKKKLSEL